MAIHSRMPKERQLAKLLEAAKRDRTPNRFWADVKEGLEKKQINPKELSIRRLFEELVEDGREIVSSWSPRSGGGVSGVMLYEAESAINTSDFSNITGQIVYSTVLDAWENPEFIADKVVETIPTQFSGEKIPGVSGLGDEAASINEGDPYPLVGASEEWVETPETTKRGFIVPVTKEAIFFDRTGLVLQRAAETSKYLRINKEKRVLDAVLGISTLYKRNGATTAVATYGDNSGTHDWDNLQASNALVDWTDIENAELLFDGMFDPNTGEPIMVSANQVIVPSALKYTAMRVLNATDIRFGDGASSTTAVYANNPVGGKYEILSNAYVKARTSSASTWFLGDFRRGFKYMENWPITTAEAPVNSEMEFSNDIVNRFKVSERGAVAVVEPRCAVKSTA